MSGAVEGVDRAKAMLLGDEDTQGIRPHVTFADHSYPAYSKQQMIDFALLYAASLTTPPARTYAYDREAVGALAIHLAATASADQEEHGEWTWRDIAAAAIRLLSQGEKA